VAARVDQLVDHGPQVKSRSVCVFEVYMVPILVSKMIIMTLDISRFVHGTPLGTNIFIQS